MEASKVERLLRIPLRACCPTTLAAERRVANHSYKAFLSTRATAQTAASYPKRSPTLPSRRSFSYNSTAQTGQGHSKKARLSSILAVSAGVAATIIYTTWSQEPMRADCECCGHEEGLDDLEPKEKKPYISFSPSAPVPGSAELPNLEVYELLEEAVPDISKLPVEKAVLTTAPYVPPTITRDYPVLLKVGLTTGPKLAQLTSQYKYEQWTFNNTVPGPFIRARVGDVVEVTLTNRDVAGNPHNVDCHAFTGPGGGAAVTTAEEGESKTAKFRLLYPGLYVYHCAAAPVPVHISNGMYGLMYVQPAEGDLPPVDREYYVMQSEFYHEPPETLEDGRRSDIVEFSYPNGLREEPNVVVFNGSESALTRDHPLKATVGESVRIFFGNAGPNLRSSFHMIGTVFKNVYRDGDVVSPPGHFIQTVCVPPAGSTIVDMKMSVPGTYTMVDHAMFRLDKGAVGFLNVSGDPRPDVYQSSQPPAPCTGCKLHS